MEIDKYSKKNLSLLVYSIYISPKVLWHLGFLTEEGQFNITWRNSHSSDKAWAQEAQKEAAKSLCEKHDFMASCCSSDIMAFMKFCQCAAKIVWILFRYFSKLLHKSQEFRKEEYYIPNDPTWQKKETKINFCFEKNSELESGIFCKVHYDITCLIGTNFLLRVDIYPQRIYDRGNQKRNQGEN